MRATGTFEVKLAPVAAHAEGLVGRMSIDKQFAGDLAGVSKGEMLAVMSKEKGSGGYVAMEHGTGELTGLAGSLLIIVEGKKHSYEFEYTLAL